MHVYAATTNAGKLRELRDIFCRNSDWRVEPFDGYAPPDEGETSYACNAALKARALFAQMREGGVTGAGALGDDSGLEVAALDGRPGVLSARYGGGAAWPQRRRMLLDELADAGGEDRAARFVCALHYIAADGREFAAEADVRGRIAPVERGRGGFSYDAIFELPERGLTFAEMPEEEKNRLSHRMRAAEYVLALVDAARRASTA